MLSLFNPQYLKELCQKYRLTPSKKYGQNFLISDAPIKKMLETGELSPEDTVIEIGPGFGILTFALAERVKKVIAFEIERKLEDYWGEKLEDQKIKRSEDHKGEIEIVWGNALTQFSIFNFQFLKKYKVIANLPYQITSHALRTILELPHKPERIVVMVQKEVAEKICAQAGDMSLLSVSVQYYGEPSMVAKVSRGAFWPSPKVDSAIIQVKNLKSKVKSQDADAFFRVVKAGFAHKRKQLWRNLADGLKLPADDVKQAVAKVIGNEKVRAEELSVAQWLKLVSGIGD